MNKNSLISQYIGNNLSTYHKDFSDKGISIKFYSGLAIFNYNMFIGGHLVDFSDPIVQEARGIIIDLWTLDVVCWPFRKFGNYSESYADDIDWNSARIQEKIDGSIIKLWYNRSMGGWHWSTNSVINADEALSFSGKSYYELIQLADNFNDIKYDSLDRSMTYIFELVSPLENHVVTYPVTRLYHIGTRNNDTGKEYNIDIGIIKPKEYTGMNSLGEVIDKVKTLNSSKNNVIKEGFVVVDKDWHRIKVKSPEYFIKHRINDSVKIDEDKIIGQTLFDSYLTDDNYKIKAEEYLYKYKLYSALSDIENYIEYSRAIYEELNYDRSAFAKATSKDKLQTFGFLAIDNPNYSAVNICLLINRYTKLKKYMEEDHDIHN